MILPHVAARVFNRPLAIAPGKAVAILAGIGGRLVEGGVVFEGGAPAPLHHVVAERTKPHAGRLGNSPDEAWGARYDAATDRVVLVRPGDLQMVGGVAIIPIEGTLVHKGKWVASNSGETSYEWLFAQVMAAQSRKDVAAVVFEVDSCGGEVSGAFDLADAIFALSAEKPTIAILTDYALSAGYLLASAARAIVMPSTGLAGSIGVIALHVDASGHISKEGLKVTVLAAGKNKADGNPFGPLPEDVAVRFMGEIEDLRGQFCSAVGRYRGARFTAATARSTESREYGAVDDPVALGLVDAIARPSEAFEAFVAEVSRPLR